MLLYDSQVSNFVILFRADMTIEYSSIFCLEHAIQCSFFQEPF